jgi:hypothetical protein
VAGSVLAVLALGALVAGAFAAGKASAPSAASESASASSAASESVTQRPPVDPTGLGTDPYFNAQASRCHDGKMGSCDDLYDESEPMSRYEQYGMTCGGRVKPFDVRYCTDLD